MASGKYYTQQEARDLVDYCKQRRVLLIPEIDIEDEKQIVRDNNLYAYLLAFAERSWRGGGYGYFDGKDALEGIVYSPDRMIQSSDRE